MNDQHAGSDQKLQIALAWTVVGIPFAYGIYNSVKAALDLFTG
ncbi:MFS transporter small subunit [Nocardioides sambongensis]|nr:hypothetical protein [Nocardioides sambongensis]